MDIFFDLDGTLLDVWPRHYAVYRDLLVEWGRAPLEPARYQMLKRANTSLNDVLAESGARELTEPFRRSWLARIEQHDYLDKDTVIATMRALLDRFGADHRVVLVTLRQSPQALTQQLEHLSLSTSFHAVLVAGDSAADWSFKARLIREFAHHPEGWLVGDTEADVGAAKAVGLGSCAVTWGLRSPEFLAALAPDRLVDNVDTLPGILQDSPPPL